ncbi:MAG TPA: OmpA family protein [Gammaproteobacteria bacterium]|nr:OmpA family protein [Gammaproteobacteria bacterium]
MANALKPNPGALLRRGISYALLALSAGCATRAPQTQYPLAAAGQPAKGSQGVCVQIGPTPADGKPACNQLAQPDLQHHVEPLPLDEFGYLFPPLKPESKLASTSPPAATTKISPQAAAPSIAQTAVPITEAAPVTALPTIPATVVPIMAVPVPSVSPPAVPNIASTPVPATQAAPAIPIAVAPFITAPIHSISTPPAAAPHYILKTIRFSTRLPFKLNSAHLSRKNRTDLLAFVNSLEQYRGIESIRITGHTDKSGPARFNKWLSGMRAKSTQLWLLSLGIDPRTTLVRGVASSEPRPHAHNPADNRYVDLEVVVRVPAS